MNGWHLLAATLLVIAGIIFAVHDAEVIGLILINLGALFAVTYIATTWRRQ